MAKVDHLKPLDPELQPEVGVAHGALWRAQVDLAVVTTWAWIPEGMIVLVFVTFLY